MNINSLFFLFIITITSPLFISASSDTEKALQILQQQKTAEHAQDKSWRVLKVAFQMHGRKKQIEIETSRIGWAWAKCFAGGVIIGWNLHPAPPRGWEKQCAAQIMGGYLIIEGVKDSIGIGREIYKLYQDVKNGENC